MLPSQQEKGDNGETSNAKAQMSKDAVRGVSEEEHSRTLAELAASGVRLVKTEALLKELEVSSGGQR